jgi:hypothetical protein
MTNLPRAVVTSIFMTAAILAVLATAAFAQSQGQIMPGDKGRWHGYMPPGYIGAHRTAHRPHSCTWSVTAACAAWRTGSYARGGIEHRVTKRFPNGRYIMQVYHDGARVK